MSDRSDYYSAENRAERDAAMHTHHHITHPNYPDRFAGSCDACFADLVARNDGQSDSQFADRFLALAMFVEKTPHRSCVAVHMIGADGNGGEAHHVFTNEDLRRVAAIVERGA